MVFDDLVGNINPNEGNWLFDPLWNFFKIECSRCFTHAAKIAHDVKTVIRRIDHRSLSG